MCKTLASLIKEELHVINPVISSKALWEARGDEQLVVLYTRLADIRSGDLESIHQKIILDAQLFDFESVFVDEHATLPHTMCSAAKFQNEARKLGINSDSNIVVYDSQGFYSAPRVWWMFKSMGHENIRVLNGGLNAWRDEGFPVSDTPISSRPNGDFESAIQDSLFVDASVILGILHKAPEHLVCDARAAGRFEGSIPEPRIGIRSGHIPSSINLPFQNLIENGFLKTPDQLSELFSIFASMKPQHLYFSCGSGVTACVLAIAAYSLGYENIHVYDGSWTEWGGSMNLPIEQ